jgi:cell division protein ZapA
MANVNVKISIGDRIYPLVVPEEQEENLRKAAKLVTDKMREYVEEYAVRDKQDVLGMAALFFATEMLNSKATQVDSDGSLAATLTAIEEALKG